MSSRTRYSLKTAAQSCVAAALAVTILANPVAAASSIVAAPAKPGPLVAPYVRVQAPTVVLRHVTVIDGRGGAARHDMSVTVQGGKITAITSDSDAPPSNVTVLDLPGHTVIPGLVGMHDHLFYIAYPYQDSAGHSTGPTLGLQMNFSAPRLYLAGGVTTIRTAGSMEPYADLNNKHMIDAGTLPGPHMDVTGPYLDGPNTDFIQMPELKDADDTRRTVAYWADRGVTSFKAYAHLTREELKAAIDEVHKRGLKITGHLCSITYAEAAMLGIDNIEHGFAHETSLDPGKAPDACPPTNGRPTLHALDPDTAPAKALIRLLVDRHVALTSTLPVSEHNWPNHAPLNTRALAVLTPEARIAVLEARDRDNHVSQQQADDRTHAYRNDMALQRQFAQAGGLLLAGLDPTGEGDAIPGFGDQREVELLVEAGFTPEEAIKIATYNGAVFLGLTEQIGSIEVGKRADLVVLNGDPSSRITDIENVEIVFKDGVGYDSARLLESVRGRYGRY